MNTTQRKSPWGWIALTLGLFFIIGIVGLGLMTAAIGSGGEGINGEQIGVIEVSGAIADEGAASVVGGRTYGARDIIESLEKAERDSSIKAVVIRINSPGGSASASQEIYNAVQKVKATGKPVICSMGDSAASGGYYIAAGCDTIYANGSTLTGSIGVIFQLLNYEQLFRKVGLTENTLKSGKFKDIGSPTRPLSAEERQLFQAMIRDVYGQFVDDVAKGRKGKLTKQQILKLADGRVYTGLQAQKLKLVDKIGGFRDAVDDAAKRASISGEPKLKYLRGGNGLLGSLLGAESESAVSQLSSEAGSAAGQAFARSVLQQMRNEATLPTLVAR